MTTVRGPKERVEEVTRLAGEAMLTWLRQFDGYRGLLAVADEATGIAWVVTFWDSAEAEAASRPGRLGIRDKLTATAGFEIVSTAAYAVPTLELPRGA
jgi:hypothetical protein